MQKNEMQVCVSVTPVQNIFTRDPVSFGEMAVGIRSNDF